MGIFFHQIPWKSRNPPENSFEWRFLSFREVHFAPVFPCEWSGPWNHMRTSKVFGKSERVDDFLQFRPLICLLFERSKKSHDLQEIIDFPELIKNLVHVSRNIFQNSCRKWKIPCFHQKTCSVESLIRLRDERTARIMRFLQNSLKKHRFDLGKSPANWKTLNFIQKSIDLTSVFPLSTRFSKNDVPQSLWFPTFERHFFDTSRNVAVAPV